MNLFAQFQVVLECSLNGPKLFKHQVFVQVTKYYKSSDRGGSTLPDRRKAIAVQSAERE